MRRLAIFLFFLISTTAAFATAELAILVVLAPIFLWLYSMAEDIDGEY